MLLHISKNPNLTQMIPRVPSQARSGWQNDTVKRICFAPSISNCISAINSLPGEIYYVYEAVNPDPKYIYKTTPSDVPDSKYTNEIWYLKPVNVKKIATIVIGDTTLYKQLVDKNNKLIHIHKNNYMKFNHNPSKEEIKSYLNSQPTYSMSEREEQYYNKLERNKTLKTILAASVGTSLLMLIGNRLLRIRR